MPKKSWSTADLPDLWHQSTDDEKDSILFLKELELSGVPIVVTRKGTVILGHEPSERTMTVLNQWTLKDTRLGLHPAGLALWTLQAGRRTKTYRTWRGVENAIHRWVDDPDKFYDNAWKGWPYPGVSEVASR
jgi:hypothetical protein